MSEREILGEAIDNGLDITELLDSINPEIIQFTVYMTSYSSRYYSIMFRAMPRCMQMETFVNIVEEAAINVDNAGIMYVADLMGVTWNTSTGVFEPTGRVVDDICLADLTRRWLASDKYGCKLPERERCIRTAYCMEALWKASM